MNRISVPGLLVAIGIFAGCAGPPQNLPLSHPANPEAQQAPERPAKPLLAKDSLTRETDRRFSMIKEVQTNEPPPIQQAGAVEHSELGTVKEGPSRKVVYTCPMHPEVRSDKPGKCPKCGMQLVKMKEPKHEDSQH